MTVDVTATTARVFDTAAVKAQFPLLRRMIDGAPLHYLDSANPSQKPQCVIDTMTRFTETSYAPINRSAYRLAAEATDAYENARAKVARFVNAGHDYPQRVRYIATEAGLDAETSLADGSKPNRWSYRRTAGATAK